eukprot:6057627-Ditylum_brightwellii.AAC.1
MGAGAQENDELPLQTAGTPTNGAGNDATGAAMEGDSMVSMYHNIMWSGILPATGACIARHLNAMKPAEEKAATQTLHEFLKDPSNHLLQLNEGANKFIALVNLPSSKHCPTCARIGFWQQHVWEHLPSNRKGPDAFRGGRRGTESPGVRVPAGKHLKLQAGQFCNRHTPPRTSPTKF